ncbi:MAG: ribosome recycling factor [Bacteroidia bacterium]|nr:ribosome recycling factor [Bacteroidia bacterium]
MDERIKPIIEKAKTLMQKAISHLESELVKIRAGKSSPVMLDGIRVEYYGNMTPLSQVANVSAPDPKTLLITPYEKRMIQAIERAIAEAKLGFNPQNDGTIIRILIPQLTEDRRKQLVKQAKEVGEEARVSIRSIRRDHNDLIKKTSKDGVAEDVVKTGEQEIQKLTDSNILKVDKVLSEKEVEIMKV